MELGSLSSKKIMIGLSSLLVASTAAGLFLFSGDFLGSELYIETSEGEAVEGDVFLDGERIGHSDDGVVHTSEDEVNRSSSLRVEGLSNDLYFDRTYSTDEIRFEDELLVLKIPSEDIGTHEISFVVEPSGEALDGRVYSNGQALGDTSDGEIRASPELGEEVVLEGEWEGSDFEIRFEYSRDARETEEIEYYAEESYLESLTFEASELDTDIIEEEILGYINDKRLGEEVPPPAEQEENGYEEVESEPSEVEDEDFSVSEELFMDESLRDFAQYKSNDMLDRDYFSHDDLEGRGHRDHLREREIPFAVSNENLHNSQARYYWNETDMARQTVRSWLDSPGHRSLVVDRDKIYTDAGIGVSCGEEMCYATFVAAQQSKVVNEEVPEGYCVSDQLYDEAWGYNYGIDIKTEFQVDGALEVNFVEDTQQGHNDCISDQLQSQEQYTEESFEHTAEDAEPGYGIVIRSNEASEYTYKVQYE